MPTLRVTALLPFALAVVSFALTIVFVVAGRAPGVLDNQFILSINATKVGQDIIKLDRVNATSAGTATTRTPTTRTPTTRTPTATSATPTSTSNPLDALNPFSTSSPFNPNNLNNPLSDLGNIFDPLVANLTDSFNGGVEDAINGIVSGMVDSAGIKDFYYIFLQKICSGNVATNGGNADGIAVDKCESYDDATDSLEKLVGSIQSSVVIANTNISVPLISELTGSLGGLSDTISGLGKFILASFIISLIGSALSALLSLPAILFSKSRVLIYLNMFWPLLASLFAFLGAILVSIIIVAFDRIGGGFGGALNIYFKKGSQALVFVWLAWLFISMGSIYWVAIWFVEVRSWRIVTKKREGDERGNWGGVLGRFRKSRVKESQ